eukprot:TRINITY_DN6042_c0_g1_i1.p1 TRINITY_DN6042_c0_g1~~TRINITY_DN6042_c0_g1_i1.p1  ORF type:complete len:118 (+),score=17.76 TRINITY_DN6042_c0_g1_i1:173-526(+)
MNEFAKFIYLIKLLGSKLAQILGNKRTVSSSGSTVHVVGAAVPVDLWATSSWALSSLALLLGSHLDELLTLATKDSQQRWRAQYSVVWAAVPVRPRGQHPGVATSSSVAIRLRGSQS